MALAKEFDKPVAKSKKDALGVIIYREFTGAEKNKAYKVAKKFEKQVGSPRELAEKLEAVEGDLPADMKKLLPVLRHASQMKRSLPVILAEQQVSLTQTLRWYAAGLVALSKVEAAIAAHQSLPRIVKDIARHAQDQPGGCVECRGSGIIKVDEKDIPCKFCDGEGTAMVSSPHKEWAAKAILNTTGMEKKGPATEVNVAVGVNIAGGKSYTERMIGLADKALYGKDIIDAEVAEIPEVDSGSNNADSDNP